MNAFLYRYVIVNTFTNARCQGLIFQQKSLSDFQWDLLDSYMQKRNEVHAPVLVNSRGTCVTGGGRTWFKCAACSVSFPSYHACFATFLGGSSCIVKITPNAPNLDHAKK